MKKVFTAILMLASFGLFDAWQSTTTTHAATLGSPQVRIQIGRHRRYRNRIYRPYGERVGYGRTFTRDVWRGRHLYRETYRVRYGQTMLVSRIRLN